MKSFILFAGIYFLAPATQAQSKLHIGYWIPWGITGSGQARGNSGIFLAALPWGACG